MAGPDHPALMYGDLAEWWPLLSAPEEYAEAADFYRQAIVSATDSEVRTMVEFGSGGGGNAFHLKNHFDVTLVDLSPAMLEVSKKLNPECSHLPGDMRTTRLGRRFDAVLIQDAIVHMTTEADLRSAIRTAFEHCRAGGVALFAPDHTRETFSSDTHHGGHDRADRSLRYLEWTWDPDPGDSTYITYMAYVMRERDGKVRRADDTLICGLFGEREWLDIISEAGFSPRSLRFDQSEKESGSRRVFIGLKPDGPKSDGSDR